MLQASGEIVYFCNGRAVSADHSGASKIIHAHRNCTEWFVIVCNSFFLLFIYTKREAFEHEHFTMRASYFE